MAAKKTNGGGTAAPPKPPAKPPAKPQSRGNARMKSPAPAKTRKDYSNAPLRRFELLAGKLHGPGGEDVDMWKYVKGQPNIVESPYPLDEMFANKVRCIDGPTKLPRDFDPTFDQTSTVDLPLAVQKQHAENVKAEMEEGEEEHDEATRGPATRIDRHRATGSRGRQGDQTAERKRVLAAQGVEEDDEGDPQLEAVNQPGLDDSGGEDGEDDVSEQFPTAEEAGFSVWKHPKHGYVVRTKEGDVVGEDPEYMKTKPDVKKFIKDNAPTA